MNTDCLPSWYLNEEEKNCWRAQICFVQAVLPPLLLQQGHCLPRLAEYWAVQVKFRKPTWKVLYGMVCSLSTLSRTLISLETKVIVFWQPSSVSRLLWAVFCKSSTVGRLLSAVYCQLSSVSCLLSVVYCEQSTVSRQLSAVYCQLPTVSRLTSAVKCQLNTVSRLVSAVSRSVG